MTRSVALAPPTKKPCAAVFDVDGVLVDCRRRLSAALKVAKLREPPRSPPDGSAFWRAFLCDELLALDEPNWRMVSVAKRYARMGYAVVCLTGRPEALRRPTEEQLRSAGVPFRELVMRPDGDGRSDAEFKSSALVELSRRYAVLALFEDSPECAEAARRVLPGAEVILVGPT